MYPEITADSADEQNAKKAMAIAAADESVNVSSASSLMLSVCGMAADAADIRRYAMTCTNTQAKKLTKISLTFQLVQQLYSSDQFRGSKTQNRRHKPSMIAGKFSLPFSRHILHKIVINSSGWNTGFHMVTATLHWIPLLYRVCVITH